MKLTKNKNYKPYIVLILLAIVIAGGATAYVLYFNTHKQKLDAAVNVDPPTTEQQNAGNQTKDSTINGNSETKEPSDTPANGVSNTTVTTTSSTQNGSLYQLRFIINNIISSGTCTLTLTKGSTTIIKTSAVQALAQSSTCKGFDIATSELSSGTWMYTIAVASSDYSGSNTGTIEIE